MDGWERGREERYLASAVLGLRYESDGGMWQVLRWCC